MSDAPEFPDARRKIVGEAWIDSETVIKEKITKNTVKSVIRRTRTRALLLECGHKLAVTNFAKLPTKTTTCHVCDWPRVQHEMSELDEKIRRASQA